MLLSKEQISKIRKIIELNYTRLLLEISGKGSLTTDQIELLEESDIDISKYSDSLLKLIYINHFLNKVDGKHQTPTSEEWLRAQQNGEPDGQQARFIEHLNDNLANYINKIKSNAVSKFDEIIRAANLNYYHKDLIEEDVGKIFKEETIAQIKQSLRDASKDLSKDWQRVATTEISNAISLGGLHRIASENENNDLGEVYVYRLVVPDTKACDKCKEFFLDYDGSPVLYRLSTLLSNGSNVGKKQVDWLPGIGAIHPNERCSTILQLPRGWRLGLNGNNTYMGKGEWDDYIKQKLRG